MSTGLDWKALSDAYEARLDSEEQGDHIPVERREKRRREAEQAEIDAMTDEQRKERQREWNRQYARRQATKKRGMSGRYASRPRKFDRDQMIALFKEGLSNVEIAAKMDCGQSTVAQAIREAGFKQKSGRKPSTICVRGHEQSVHRRHGKNGHGYCGACKDIRTAQEKQKRHEAKAAREKAKHGPQS